MLVYAHQAHKPVSTASGAVVMVILGLPIFVRAKLFRKKKSATAPMTIAMEK